MRGPDVSAQPDEGGHEREPRLAAAWMCVLQAELMLQHLSAAAAVFPQANLYCHSCVTAIRSVTLTLQKALRHDQGFPEWYREVQLKLSRDSEFAFLKEARNFVLKEGSLQLMMSFSVKYTGPLHMELRGVGPNGPDIWVGEPGRMVPADWRKLEGLEFDVPLRLGHVDGLPEPPDRELRSMLEEKILHLRLILHEAERRFDPECADEEQATADQVATQRLGRK
jgi:hypothetical protein